MHHTPPRDNQSTSKQGTIASQPRLGQHQFQTPLVGFIGRKEELIALVTRLHDPACHLLTITGAGGIGKTRLAQQLAAQQTAQFEDGAVFVTLAGVTELSHFISSLATALELMFSGQAAPSNSY